MGDPIACDLGESLTEICSKMCNVSTRQKGSCLEGFCLDLRNGKKRSLGVLQ